jgi:hypothetical protein
MKSRLLPKFFLIGESNDTITTDEDGGLEEFQISANGTEIDHSRQESMYDVFRQISGHLPG